MTCNGTEEKQAEGWAFDTYQGYRLGFNSIISTIAAHTLAGHRLDRNIENTKASICNGLCEEDGCECKVTDFPDPTAYNNPTVEWHSLSKNWLGLSTSGRYDVTYHYLVKAECTEKEK